MAKNNSGLGYYYDNYQEPIGLVTIDKQLIVALDEADEALASGSTSMSGSTVMLDLSVADKGGKGTINRTISIPIDHATFDDKYKLTIEQPSSHEYKFVQGDTEVGIVDTQVKLGESEHMLYLNDNDELTARIAVSFEEGGKITLRGKENTKLSFATIISSEEKAIKYDSATKGLKTEFSFDIKSEEDKTFLYLNGVDGAELCKIDASVFIKDGMLESVELITEAEPEVTTEVPYLKFVFNTVSGKEVIRISVKSLVDIYTAGYGLLLENNEFSVDTDVIATKEYVASEDAKLAQALAQETASRETLANQTVQNIATLVTAIQNEGAVREAKDNELAQGLTNETAAREELAQALAQETVARETLAKQTVQNIATLVTAIQNEGIAREAKDNDLAQGLTNEITAREAKDNELAQGLANEIAAREAKDNELAQGLAQEIAARETLTNQTAQSIATLVTAIQNETTAREAKDTELQTAITAEANTRAFEDGKLSDAINAEANTRALEDGKLSDAIVAEGQTRALEDGKLSDAIVAESNTRAFEDGKLADGINAEKTERETDVARLEDLIAELNDKLSGETEDRKDADEELQTSIDELEEKVETFEKIGEGKVSIKDYITIEQIKSLFTTTKVNVESTDFEANNVNSPDSYVTIQSGNVTPSANRTVNGKSVAIDGLDINPDATSATYSLKVVATENVLIDDMSISGAYNKSVGGNALVSVDKASLVDVNGLDVSATGCYNALEVGLDTSSDNIPSIISIKDVNIDSTLSNNGINLFSFKDNANVVIENCHFAKVSNPIRISNATNAKNVTITIKNCQFDAWETTPAYAGLILFQDYTSASVEEAELSNQFSPANFSIIVENVTGPNGLIEAPVDIASVCASADEHQLFYVYRNKGGVLGYDENKYPQITIK